MANSPVSVVRRAMGHQRGELALAGLLGAGASFCAVALLGISAWLLATAATHPPVLTLSAAAVLVRAAAIGRAALRYAERLVGHDAAFRGLTRLRVQVYRALERLAPTGLAAFSRGDALTRIVGDVDTALDLPLRVILPWAQAALVAAATVGMLTWILPANGVIIAVASLISLAAIPALAGGLARGAEARLAPARGELAASVVRALDAAPDLVATGALAKALDSVRDRDRVLTSLQKRESAAMGAGDAAALITQGVAVAGVLLITVPAVAAGHLGAEWLAVAALLPLALMDVLGTLPGAAVAALRVRASATQLAEVMGAPDPVAPPTHTIALPQAAANGSVPLLRVRDLSARWQPPDADAVAALHDVTFDVPRGATVAIVGPSGAGKSTLVSVLMGFLPYEGMVTYAGVELRDAAGDDIRAQIGLLTQRAHIFDTTVAENLRVGDRDADDQALVDVMAAVQLDGWLAARPQGLHTPVGAFGVAMSGGERQRLALARLLLARRDVVILDEPTEHLDPKTADAVGATLRETLAGSTVVVITHRMRDAQDADLIVQLEDGVVTATGTHDTLVRDGGWYADQWRLQRDEHELERWIATLPVGVGVAAASLDASATSGKVGE